MNMEIPFEFTEKNGGACVTKLLSPGAACVIPERLGGLPVTELGDRAFAGSGVKEVFLPRSLKRIGRYCFYGCERLEAIHLYASAAEIGGGVLNGCGAVRDIFIHMEPDERSALKDFVTEINERVTVHYFLPDAEGKESEAARLIFPIYYDEAVENTPARITVSNIHGTGQKYRYCFDDKKVRFDKYDKLFVYEKAEEPVLAAAEIAIYRLMYPRGLWEDAKRAYETFIRENLFEILLGNLGQTELFKWLTAEFAEGGSRKGDGEPGCGQKACGLSKDELDRLILETSGRRMAELSGILMDLKHRSFPAKKKTFEF